MTKQYEVELEKRIETLTKKLVETEEKLDIFNIKKEVYRFRVFVRKPIDSLSFYLFEQIFFNDPSEEELKAFSKNWTFHHVTTSLAQQFFGIVSGIDITSFIIDKWDSYINGVIDTKERLMVKGLKVFDYTQTEQVCDTIFELGVCLAEVNCGDKLSV